MATPAPTQISGTTTGAAAAPSAPSTPSISGLPGAAALLQASKIAIEQDKPIQLDYFTDSATHRAFIGEDGDTKEKVLVKSKDEFTSLVSKMYKVGEDFLILTENSIYIVSGKIQKRKVNFSALHGDN